MTLLYSFFIIIDTDDPSSFWVEMTKMNYRLAPNFLLRR